MPEFSIFLAPAGSVAFYTRLTREEWDKKICMTCHGMTLQNTIVKC